ncbi:PilZ domain-containing protein [Psychromonas aquimarina]|uniref:PilZ domain-containing protein n=1 Tax=Psychromonas aquimarina TaxID=444919 RepID=UPI000428A645|nr:PilZ domain-containing protein [Psychromonas aquimarina]
MDFKDYQSQIRELIPLRNAPDFNDLLNKILFGETTSVKFLIKMELNRLSQPCQRIIDLRHKVTEDCQLHQQDGLKHYLTKDTIKVLQETIELYGLYTVGVYEYVHYYLLQQKQRQTEKHFSDSELPVKEEQCEFLRLSQKSKRSAPRMFFVSDVQLILEDGTILNAQTSNISSSGLKVKLHEDIHMLNDQYIEVIFTGLKNEYSEALLENKINYQLIKQKHNDNIHYFYLMYADDKDLFINFIREFIRINQHKYKIDVHYYYQLAKISALKHCYLAQMNSLPVYLDCSSSSPFIFALKNKSNEKIVNEWICEGNNQLPILFNELRLTKQLARMQQSTSTLYCFTHSSGGKQYFLSATEEELIEKNLKNLFISYGQDKSSWRVYQLTLRKYQYQQNQNNHYDITEPVPAEFERATHIATLEPLTKVYPQPVSGTTDKYDLSTLNQFVHIQNEENEARIFTLFSTEKRKEERYLYESQIVLNDKGQNYQGKILDLSLSGLKIQLDKIVSLAPGSKVSINLKELQRISKKFVLNQLHYQVVCGGPNNSWHLQVCETNTLKVTSSFFALLIQNNAKHFECLPLTAPKQPAAKRLIEISEEALTNCIFFIGKESGRPKIRFAAIDVQDHPLHKLFSMCSDNPAELNYYPLANNLLYERLIAQPFKNIENEPLLKEALIYVRAVQNQDKEWQIHSLLDNDFKSEQEKRDFIIKSEQESIFYALHYRLSALDKPDLATIKPEIRAISRFAIHLTKKLEEELAAVNAMIEIFDRSEEILDSLNITRSAKGKST